VQTVAGCTAQGWKWHWDTHETLWITFYESQGSLHMNQSFYTVSMKERQVGHGSSFGPTWRAQAQK
jgi:hypothetical protein